LKAVARARVQGQRHRCRIDGEPELILAKVHLCGDVDVVLATCGNQPLGARTEEFRRLRETQA
jgi:hypothetical protein